MCGIAGVLHLDGRTASPAILRRMTNSLIHRGPDGEGLWVDGSIGLGHRRLAIIDLSAAGHQPMKTRCGRFVITFNGEIYNYRELRATLETKGYRFRSACDTEVLIEGFAEWGVGLFNRLNGMFAFAIWDKRDRQLFLARDRYGIKPLYYYHANGLLLFGSEVKALVEHPEISSEANPAGMLEYFTFQNFFTDQTFLKDIRLLPAANFLVVKLGGEPHVEQYWDYCFEEPTEVRSDNDYADELDYLFTQAVSRQLVSDVEVGAYLSGGMDSGAITAVASKQLKDMRTFTCGFDLSSASGMELGFDERRAAESMSYTFQTEQYEMVLKAGDMERCLPKLAWHLEEPRVGQSYPNFYAAQLASKFNKVVLAGTGGDELFGGYPWRYYRAVVNDDFEHYIDKYYSYWQRLVPNAELKQLFTPVADDVKHVWTRDIFRDVFKNQHAESLSRPEDYVNHSLYLEAKTFLHGLLVVEDKLSMAHSLETRVPFLDNDLVDFAMRLPARLKLGKLDDVVRLNENEPGEKTAKYFQKTNDGKLILRNVMARHVPAEVLEREKQGFSAPDASWFKGDSIEYVKREVFNKSARMYDFLDRDSVQRMVGLHLDGKENKRLFVWSILNFEHWCRHYLP
ncbi:MAG: asparagine synthase (glutamine-hydrolyzing) [Parvibaculaceae bacterium]|nr:asparagine synthase (glutamine-hydrolyzing) [Parvibaculaceae bacterium]